MGTRTPIGIVNAPGTSNPAIASGTETAGDAANDHEWALRPGDRLYAERGTGTQTVTILGVSDSQGRAVNLTRAVGTGGVVAFGPFSEEGWKQPDGNVYVDLGDSDWTLQVVRG